MPSEAPLSLLPATSTPTRPLIEAAEGGAAGCKRPGRPRKEDKAPRKSRATVAQVTPCFVDMGTLTLHSVIRYDAGQQRYDVEDLLDAAHFSAKGFATSRRMTKVRKSPDVKEDGDEYGRVKWLEDPYADMARVKVRVTARAAAAAALLRQTVGQLRNARASALAYWIEQNGAERLEFLPVIGGGSTRFSSLASG